MITFIVILGAIGAVFITCFAIAYAALKGAGMTSRMEEKMEDNTND